jgi:hypothetical protein
MELDENDYYSNERQSFELLENLLEKSNIFSFFEKIAIEVYRFLQKLLQKSQNL